MISQTRKGEFFVFSEAVFWAFFPIITILTYSSLSPLASLAWSTLFATIFFGCVMATRGKLREIFTPNIYKEIFVAVVFIGWLYYGLYFAGLKFTTAGNAGLIALMEMFFSYLLFNVWRKEIFSAYQTWGAVLMLAGAMVILFPKQGLAFYAGDFLVLAATACSPIGNLYQQKLRKKISSETILFLRGLFSFPVFFLLAAFLRQSAGWYAVSAQFWLLALNGILILGLAKIFWIEGIHRISVTKSTALSAVTPALTLLLASLILHQPATIWQIIAFVPMAAGLWLLTA